MEISLIIIGEGQKALEKIMLMKKISALLRYRLGKLSADFFSVFQGGAIVWSHLNSAIMYIHLKIIDSFCSMHKL